MERQKILNILRDVIFQNKIKKAYLFGSFARNEKRYNDIDIAIEPPVRFSLLDLVHMANLLEDKLGIRVDIITTRSIHPKLRSAIEKEMVAL